MPHQGSAPQRLGSSQSVALASSWSTSIAMLGRLEPRPSAARAEKRGIYLAEWKPKGQGGSGATSSLTAFTAPTLPQDAFSGTPSVAVPQGPVEGSPDQGAGLVDPVQGNE